MIPHQTQPAPLSVQTDDGHVLRGFVWRHRTAADGRPVVIINPATSVRCRYYARFASFLHRHGFDVVTYDYRGIGESRPASLRGFHAGWIDWGRHDFEAVLRHTAAEFPGQPVQVVAHSVGGVLIGLAPSNHLVSRVFSMGAQFAYWRDYAQHRRLGMLFKWHVVMPALTALFGYFPGKRLGWLEDTPRGVVRDWTARQPRFEDTYRRGSRALSDAERRDIAARFAAVPGPTLALSVDDDEFGTIAAVQRLLRYYRNSPTTHLHLAPEAVGQKEIGHFAFFHSRFEQSLWRIPLEWLRAGHVPPEVQRHVLAPAP
ncbi:MAG: alpha/beta fold hydrolase [Rhodocyclaceae bacterium]|nr:alpha/beta fold hydrolase [Rhodocyclaceae bacterium]